MKKFIIAMMLSTTVVSGLVCAHGAEPKHGGITKTASDLQFEMVVKNQDATLYVEDHGEPVPTASAKGKITILNGKEKTEVDLTPAGHNVLEAKNVAQLKSGSKVMASIHLENGKKANVRFSIK